MQDFERERLLERVDRPGAVGSEIPERAGDLLAELRRERLQRRQHLETAAISATDGESVVETIEGLGRAIDALESLDSVGLAGADRQQTVADAKAWTSFRRQVL